VVLPVFIAWKEILFHTFTFYTCCTRRSSLSKNVCFDPTSFYFSTDLLPFYLQVSHYFASFSLFAQMLMNVPAVHVKMAARVQILSTGTHAPVSQDLLILCVR
jgi:hypothetical protein